jgi:hypothetical protein
MFRDTQEVPDVIQLVWQQVEEALNIPWWQKIVLISAKMHYGCLC